MKIFSWALMTFCVGFPVADVFGGEEVLETRLDAGDRMPEAAVRTADAERIDLAETIRGKTTLLVFYRGGWCPFCNAQLAELAKVEAQLNERGIEILAISPDRPELVGKNQENSDFSYRLLSDSDMEAARAFGIAFQVEEELVRTYKENHGIDLEADSGRNHHLLPHPAVYLVDPEGVIRYALVNPDYRDRLSAEDILEMADELNR